MGEVTAAAQAAGSLHALSGLVVHYQAALSATVAVACFMLMTDRRYSIHSAKLAARDE